MLGVALPVGCYSGTRWSSAGAAGAGSLGYGTACFATVVTLTNALIVIPAVQTPA